MRERVVNFFQNLPPEGIAIHGTNKSRAKIIQQEGFNPQKEKSLLDTKPLTWYLVQPPNINQLYWKIILDDIKRRTLNAQSHAIKAAQKPIYWTGQNPEDDKTPSIVVFRPLRKFDRSSIAFNQAPFPIIMSEEKPIPQNHILGFFDVDRKLNPVEMTRGIINVLTSASTIYQSPNQKQHGT